MKNIEIKVKVSDRAGMMRLIRKLGAKREAVLRQADTYFTVPTGRLKLREENSRQVTDLIFYDRADTKASRMSDYQILMIAKRDTRKLKNFLSRSLGVKVIVKKARTLYLYRNTRIHVDRVDSLGDYLELETVLKRQSTEEAKKEHQHVIEMLQLDHCERVPVSYSDMLLMKNK